MFRTLLIANRGEIACRIIATARRLGLRTVAVYSDADANARHVRLADEAVRIGPAAARESYLVVDHILEAARRTGADAIHPGYGFLSENAELAEACVAAGIVFVGPSAASIRAMGSKSEAKKLMGSAQVPLTPGYHGDNQEPAFLEAEATKIGYPVLIKASAGGGGKGMRRVDAAADFAAALVSCQRESKSAFDSEHVLIEKYVERPRHIEVQIFGDSHGNYVHLFERDCSVQRRHQKVLEEAPAPGMTEARRTEMGNAAILAAKAVQYQGAGTVEFIVDPSGTFFFMEMNTRLQVEHPVTEKITGLDLVEWQLRVAAGEPLPKTQDQLQIHGHAIEARIYAENPDAGFLPQAGTLLHLVPPATSEHVRIDTGVEQGDAITPHYDPMIAKLIVWGADRREALGHMQNALDRYEIVGLATNVEFLGRLVRTRSFSEALLDTSLIEREHDALQPPSADVPAYVWQLAGLAVIDAERAGQERREAGSPWSLDGFRLGASAAHSVTLRHGESNHELRAEAVSAHDYLVEGTSVHLTRTGTHGLRLVQGTDAVHATVVPNGERWHVFSRGRRWDLEHVDPLDVKADAEVATGGLRAPMPGKVIAHLVEAGATVKKGAPLMVLEAMKMELTISAPKDGVVATLRFAPGEQVSEGAELVVFEAETAS